MSKYLSYSELREGDESSFSLAERLSKYPHLRHRMESILGIIENDDGSCQTADEAERRAIEEVRKLGQEVLQGWLGHQSDIKEAESSQKAGLIRDGKKKCIGTVPLVPLESKNLFSGKDGEEKDKDP